MNELIDFLVELQKNSLGLTTERDWTMLRPLTDAEIQQLWDIDIARAEFDYLRSEVQYTLPEERRSHVQSRHDLSDEELELLGRFVLARDVCQATMAAFWSPVKYEFRQYEQITIDSERAVLMGRGHNRPYLPSLEPLGLPNEDEVRELTRLFG